MYRYVWSAMEARRKQRQSLQALRVYPVESWRMLWTANKPYWGV
jgi:hypothetical protein